MYKFITSPENYLLNQVIKWKVFISYNPVISFLGMEVHGTLTIYILNYIGESS